MKEQHKLYKDRYRRSSLNPRILSVYAWIDGHVSINVYPEKDIKDVDKIPAYIVLNNSSRKALIKLLGGKI